MKKYRVPKTAITEKGLKRLIRDAAKSHTSVGDWAHEHSITPQAVSSFFRGVQGPGLKLPEVLGYRPQVIYLPLDEPLIQEPTAPRRASTALTSKVDPRKVPVERAGRERLSEREKAKKALKKRKA